MTRGFTGEKDAGGFQQDRVTNTRAGGTIFRHGGDPISLGGEGEGTTGRGVGAPVTLVGVSYAKRLGLQPGNFQLTIKAGSVDVFREIVIGDWVVFHWNRSGELKHGSIGIITAVRRSRSTSTGATREEWTLECQDWARIPNKTQIWFDDYTAFGSNVGGKILASRMGFTPGGSPDQMVLRKRAFSGSKTQFH